MQHLQSLNNFKVEREHKFSHFSSACNKSFYCRPWKKGGKLASPEKPPRLSPLERPCTFPYLVRDVVSVGGLRARNPLPVDGQQLAHHVPGAVPCSIGSSTDLEPLSTFQFIGDDQLAISFQKSLAERKKQ